MGRYQCSSVDFIVFRDPGWHVDLKREVSTSLCIVYVKIFGYRVILLILYCIRMSSMHCRNAERGQNLRMVDEKRLEEGRHSGISLFIHAQIITI